MRTFVLYVLGMLVASQAIAGEALSSQSESFWSRYFQSTPRPQPAFGLKFPGESIFMDYSDYGDFVKSDGLGFRYVTKKPEELKAALGEGIFPNTDVYKNPDFRQLTAGGLLRGRHWELVHSAEYQKAFFAWVQAQEDTGVKAFFIARVLENAGLIEQAIKAYYAAVVFYPRAAAWAADHSFVWYVAPAAIASIKRLCRDFGDLNCELQGAFFEVKNGGDTDLGNDLMKVQPGKIIRKTVAQKVREVPRLGKMKVVEQRGEGDVVVVKFRNGHWQLRVRGKPYYVKGVTYMPTEIGLGPLNDPNFSERWMFSDKNQNGVLDIPYETWIDDQQKPIGDFQLLKDMGVNTIRLYAPNRPSSQYDPALLNKPLLRDLAQKYGIMAIVGDFLGAYTLGSGATWEKGTDYTDPEQRRKMKEVVKAKVLDLKDEPFVLMWLLGNENNLPAAYLGVNATRTNAGSQPEAYAKFLNEVAQMIHELDPNHPVAVGNLELGLLEYYQQYAPALDVIGINSYRGPEGFGSLFVDAQKAFDRPVVMTEYGCDAYADRRGLDEEAQADYLKGSFRDLLYNKPGGPGTGTVIGGMVFEFVDEWWKAPKHPEAEQSAEHQQTGQTPDGFVHEEWFGITGQGDGKSFPPQRTLRKAYYYLKEAFSAIPHD